MSLWILDTDTLSLFQNQHPLVKQRVNQVSLKEIAVTVITVEEQMRGWLNVIRQSSQEQRLMWGYLGLRQGVEFFNTIKILDFDQNSASRYAELLRQKIRIGRQDLRIAVIAISNNGILVTRNQRDFSRVPGLQFEDWTITINN
ncbi:type II toxin-antitoxin system VapC family toxin [Iningainema tapete]|uniref:Type II toxin-antitoxin system VapC family toxin n=1 Tax=Iningainema tapete BLCC-T55 TaxID=2748662 RepID=A0A8J6XM49_9CYAN|nr:type II toxin-antitoxin system VapC family toxin [Iningainema tapete]MBD2774229.1 type II toxin-antitoxin system VapC family toxin [Iningainema tapete BLCC-T55]